MSIPPQILRIKRKRVDEPVDSLYIETRDPQHKRRVTDQDFVFRRLKEKSNVEDQPLTPSHPGIPQILATRPGDENNYRRNPTLQAQGREQLASPAGSNGSTSHLSRPESAADTSDVTPRRYHLSRLEAAAVLQAQQKRKHRQDQENDVAVFIEARRKIPAAVQNPASLAATQPSQVQEQEQGVRQIRKRPGRGAAVTKVGGIRGTPRIEDKDLELHNALQKYAMEDFAETVPAKASVRGVAKANQHDNSEDVEMLDEVDDDDYVYDTYMRYSEAKPLNIVDTTAAIGFLVITEEDKELWEIYGEDEGDSEQDWDSEQDDENAENYYGADYPEDEVASDDEFDTGAYGYRRGRGSDDEEYDVNDDVGSDLEGLEKRFPWQGKTWRRGAPEVDGPEEEDSDA